MEDIEEKIKQEVIEKYPDGAGFFIFKKNKKENENVSSMTPNYLDNPYSIEKIIGLQGNCILYKQEFKKRDFRIKMELP